MNSFSRYRSSEECLEDVDDVDMDLTTRPARLGLGTDATWRACEARCGISVTCRVPLLEVYVVRKAGRVDDREVNGGECRRFPAILIEYGFSSVSLMFSLSSWWMLGWESRTCLERDEAAARSPLSGASSRVILRGPVRGFAIDDAVGAAYEGAPDNTGPEVTRPNDRAVRSCLSPPRTDADSRTG